MIKYLVLVATLTSTAFPAFAQGAQQRFNQFDAQQRAQSQALVGGIVQRNMQDPRLIAAWRAGICGPGLTLQQFAYKYAALGGCTQQGYQQYGNTSAQINQQQQRAMQEFYAAQQRNIIARGQMFQGQFDNRVEQGRGLMGQQTYVDPRTGQAPALSYMPNSQPQYDYRTGRYYVMGQDGHYYSGTGNGYWTPMYPR